MAKTKKVIRTKYLYRNSRRKKIRNTILFTLLVFLLIGIGYLVSQEWSKRFGSDAPSSSVPSIEIPSEDPSLTESSSLPESSEPAVIRAVVQAKRIPLADMQKTGDELTAYFAQIREAGYTAVCFDLKTTDGIITYNSENELAKQYGTISETPVDLDVLVKAAKDADLTPVAKLTALRDTTASHVSRENSFAYKTPDGPNWLDNSAANGGKSWLNPYMENARRYISGLCGEISQKGISIILLEDVIFPEKNTEDLNEVNPFTTREAILAQLMAEAQEAAGADAVVYEAFDVGQTAQKAAANGADYASMVTRLGYSNLAPMLDVAAVEANKQVICENAAIVTENGYDPAITAAEVISRLLIQTQTNAGEDAKLLPVVSEADFALLKNILEQSGINSYIIK